LFVEQLDGESAFRGFEFDHGNSKEKRLAVGGWSGLGSRQLSSVATHSQQQHRRGPLHPFWLTANRQPLTAENAFGDAFVAG
jgi:hypothetical protein